MPEKTSAHADEGTLAHAAAEMLLRGEDPRTLAGVTPEMIKHLDVYVDHVLGLEAPGAVLHIEQRVKATDMTWGTADAIVWNPTTATLHVIDLKYGAGVGVEVQGNRQLRIYALAALLTMGYPAKLVNACIVQPRLPHADGLARSVDFDAVDLIDFHADLLEAADRVKAAFKAADNQNENPVLWEEKFLKPSEKACRWCLAAPKCPKLLHKAQDMAKRVFLPDLPYDARQLAETLDFVPILEGWCKNVREFAYSEAEQGRVPPTYKLVEKRATRKWKPDVNPFILASALLVRIDEVTKPKELLPVGDLMKLAPGKNAEERAAVLEPFTVKESSGYTLVHESDKREAVRIDAKAAFGGQP